MRAPNLGIACVADPPITDLPPLPHLIFHLNQESVFSDAVHLLVRKQGLFGLHLDVHRAFFSLL